MDDGGSKADRAEDDELARMVEALEAAGLVEVYERPDGASAVRLTEQGEAILQQLPEDLRPE